MSFYISNALGFFIQLAPCALMIFLPFPQSACRFPRRRILCGVTLCAAVLSALFPPVFLRYPRNLTGNLSMLFAAVVILALFFLLVREAAIKKILVFFMVLFYAVTQFCLVNILWNFLPQELYWKQGPYSFLTVLLYAASAAVTLPVMLGCMIRPLGKFIREMEPEEMRREFFIAILSTTVFIAVLMYFYNFSYWPNSEYYFSGIFLELFLLLEQLLIYWLLFQESLRRKRDGERRRAMEIQKLQYDKIQQEMENTRRLRHDLRHHLNVLGALNAQGRQEEIAAYLKQYVAVYDRLSQQSFSGDPVVDGVLGYYLAQAEDLSVQIQCEVSLSRDSGVEATDMTVLLGNLLENALTALRRLPEEERKLSIELSPVRAMLLLRIQNRCAELGDSGEPSDWTSFADREGNSPQGVGLGSVAGIAEKYSGSALFQRRDGIFTARVILNPKRDT